MLSALSLVLSAVPFLVALMLGLGLPLLAIGLYRYFAAGLWFIAMMLAVDAIFFSSVRLYLGINVYLADLGYVLLALVAALRWLLASDMPRRPGTWLVLVALFVLSLGLGLVANGTRAGVQARDLFYSLVAASYFMSFAIDALRVRQLLQAMTALAVVLLLVTGYRWLVFALDIRELLPQAGGWNPGGGDWRVIPSHEALLLAQVLVLGLFFTHLEHAAMARWIAPLVFAAVVVLQHRSVWIAGLIGVVAALALVPRMRASALAQWSALLVVVTLTALPLALSERLSGVGDELRRSAVTAVAGQGTVHSRLQDWRQTVREWARSGPRAWAIGHGFGRDTTRTMLTESGERRTIRFDAHNHYVAMLTDTGLLGLGAFVLLAVGTLHGLYRLAQAGDAPASLMFVWLLMQLAYYVPYGTDPWQHALLGMAMAYVATRRRALVAAPTPGRPAVQNAAWR